MARRKKLNEQFVVLTVPMGLANTDADFRFLAPGDATKITHWKVVRSRPGTGTAICAMGLFSAAAGAGTRIMADVSNTIATAAATLTSGADATGDVTFNDGDPIFLFLNYDAGTVTAECVATVTVFFQS